MEWIKKHKLIAAIIAIVLVVSIVGALTGKDEKNNSSEGNTPSDNNQKTESQETTYKFEDRADKQQKDVEVLPGEVADLDGMKMTLSGVEYKTALSEFESAQEGQTYIVADVTLENTSGETKPYNVFDFRVQTAGGQVLDGAISSLRTIGSGDLVTGGKATGKVVFEVAIEDGHQYVIWKPDAFKADRAIVRVK